MENFELVENLRKKLDNKEKKDLIQYLSMMCEKAYRRGVQQALHFERDTEMNIRMKRSFKDDLLLYKWRHGDFKVSKGIDGYKTTSKERFLIENNAWFGFND